MVARCGSSSNGSGLTVLYTVTPACAGMFQIVTWPWSTAGRSLKIGSSAAITAAGGPAIAVETRRALTLQKGQVNPLGAHRLAASADQQLNRRNVLVVHDGASILVIVLGVFNAHVLERQRLTVGWRQPGLARRGSFHEHRRLPIWIERNAASRA